MDPSVTGCLAKHSAVSPRRVIHSISSSDEQRGEEEGKKGGESEREGEERDEGLSGPCVKVYGGPVNMILLNMMVHLENQCSRIPNTALGMSVLCIDVYSRGENNIFLLVVKFLCFSSSFSVHFYLLLSYCTAAPLWGWS